jgi:hypothetical protein
MTNHRICEISSSDKTTFCFIFLFSRTEIYWLQQWKIVGNLLVTITKQHQKNHRIGQLCRTIKCFCSKENSFK